MKKEILSLDPSERVLFEIKRHPAGLIPIYFTGALVAIAMLAAPFLLKELSGTANFEGILPGSILFIGGVILAGFSVVVTGISVYVYKTNELVVTDQNILQILQTSLFHRKISQLSMEKVQDVTVTQKGILQTVLKYGTIYIETAGEADNFGFRYARDPHIAAKRINEAHEEFIKEYGVDLV